MDCPRRATRRFHQPRRRRAEAASVVHEAEAAWSARSYEGIEHPAKPTAARRSWPRWSSTLLDHLVRPEQEGLRNGQPNGFGRLEIDHQLELGGLLHG